MKEHLKEVNYNCEDIENWKNLLKYDKNWFSQILHPTHPR